MVGGEQFAARADDVVIQPHDVAGFRVEIGGGPVVEQDFVVFETLDFGFCPESSRGWIPG